MYCKALGQDKDEGPHGIFPISGVRLPGQCRALTGYTLFYATRVALGSQKGYEVVYTHCAQQYGAKTIKGDQLYLYHKDSCCYKNTSITYRRIMHNPCIDGLLKLAFPGAAYVFYQTLIKYCTLPRGITSNNFSGVSSCAPFSHKISRSPPLRRFDRISIPHTSPPFRVAEQANLRLKVGK